MDQLFLWGNECSVTTKIPDYEILSDIHQRIKVDVGLECMGFVKEVVKFTAWDIAWIVGSGKVISNCNFIGYVVQKLRCFLYEVALVWNFPVLFWV